MSIQTRNASDRGHFNFGWLDTWHTFSFGEYRDERFMGFRSLRVINEDFVAPGSGFPTHPHRDMEILTVVLEGELEHKDSMGNGSIIRPGDIQRMSAGTGVTHSEFNASKTNPVHLFQIWILPDRRNHEPSYEQRHFSVDDRKGRLCLVASQAGKNNSVRIHQDAELFVSTLASGERLTYAFKSGRHGWLQLSRGTCTINGLRMNASDGAAISSEGLIEVEAGLACDLLLFDLS